MKLKEYNQHLKNEELIIPDVKDKVKNSYEFKNRNYENKKNVKAFLSRNKIRFAFGAFILVLLLTITIVTINNREIKYDSDQIHYVENKKDLKEIINYAKESDFEITDLFTNRIFLFKTEDADMMMDSSSAEVNSDGNILYSKTYSNKASSTEISETNNQVENVDEADIVKCDGEKIYRLYGKKLYVNKISSGDIGDTQTIELIEDENNYYHYYYSNNSLYVTDNYVVTLITYQYKLIVKIFDKDTLSCVKEFESEYSYLDDTRLVQGNIDVLYLVFNQSIDDYELPCYYEDGSKIEKDYQDIAYFNCVQNDSYTYIVSIKLDKSLEVTSKVQLGESNWTHIYVTENSIYFAAVLYKYNLDYIRYEYTETINTVIIKYDINEGNIKLVATLATPGKVISQFAMDEYNGFFRVALSISNHNKIEVYALEEKEDQFYFTMVGSLTEGLGEENEVIKSVDFNKDECLIVTAKETDPMYKIDLSDPTNPVILGKFKEDGYNSYLQYLTGDAEGLAFGLGYLSTEISDYYIINNQSKIGLYDVTGSSPVQLDIITYDTTYVEACSNHKAIFVYKNYIGFEVAGVYHLYQVVKEVNEGIISGKLKEVMTYTLIKEELIYNSYCYSRLYYVDGYFYLSYIEDNTTHLVSLDSDYKQVKEMLH